MPVMPRFLFVLAMFVCTPALADSYVNKQPIVIQGALGNDLARVKQGLAMGNTTEVRHKTTKQTALHISAERNAVGIVSYLIDQKSALNAGDVNKATPLHLAVQAGAKQSAELLIRAGANINAVNKNGETPLILSARKAKTTMIKLLLKHGADTEIEDLTGLRAIDYAEQSRRPETAKLFE